MTTAGEAKRRIAALLAGWSALSGVDVQRSGPVDADGIRPEMIFLGSVKGDGAWKSFGKLTREETYTIALFLRLWISDTEPPSRTPGRENTVEDRCWALYDATETALRSDPALGGLLQGNMQLGHFEQDTIPTLQPVGWRSGLDCQILVKTHLRLP